MYLSGRFLSIAALALLLCVPQAARVKQASAVEKCDAQSNSGRVTETYRTDGNKRYLIDLYYVPGEGCRKLPAIIYFHGGSWKAGNRQQFARQAKIITKRSKLVVMSADYPLNGNPVEASVYGSAALCWAKINADKLGIDPSRIALAGGSAGGQVAATVSLMKVSPAQECNGITPPLASALVLFNPMLQFSGGWKRNLRGDLSSVSPISNVNEFLPPTLILQGTDDRTAPLSVAKTFISKAQALGKPNVKLVEYPGRTHGFFNNSKTGDLDSTVEQLISFLQSLGWVATNDHTTK